MKSAREQPIRIIKKVKKHGGHHGGAWKVAFADFMTSMMALFLVLWLITQSSEVRSAIAGYFQDPLGRANEFGNSVIPGEGGLLVPGHPSVQSSAGGRRERLTQLQQQIKDALPQGAGNQGLLDHVVIDITPEGLRISLLEDSSAVFFASGSARPLPRADTLFQAIGGVLGHAALPIEIEGHTDATPYTARNDYDNWELSADRANMTRRSLSTGGLLDKQVQAVRGLASRDPRVPQDPFAPQNRRVTILVRDSEPVPKVATATKPANDDLMIGHGR